MTNIKVKFMTRNDPSVWLRQLPDHQATWNKCDFTFNPDEENYDWLVVYDDLPPAGSERRSRRHEQLQCPPQNTLLVTTEPPSIKLYDAPYSAQFAHILTSQPEWALPHPGRIFSQPALQWFYGIGKTSKIHFDELDKGTHFEKSKTISTVCSNKKQRHTLHQKRYTFTHELARKIPELEIFGKGHQPIDDKEEAVTPYRYHLAIENYIGIHHWTEKLADAFLGFSLPFYIGCPNAGDYFPPQSFIPLDLNNIDEATAVIKEAIKNNEYQRRLPYIKEARKKVLYEYNLFQVVSDIIEAHTQNSAHKMVHNKTTLHSRHSLIDKDIFSRGRHLIDKMHLRLACRFERLQA
jgi:hypothetical protein